MQRVLHRLAHVYHSLSDISIDFGSGVPSSSFLRPQCAHYDHSAATEVLFFIDCSLLNVNEVVYS